MIFSERSSGGMSVDFSWVGLISPPPRGYQRQRLFIDHSRRNHHLACGGLKHLDTSLYSLSLNAGALHITFCQLAHPKILFEVAGDPRGAWFTPPTPPPPRHSSLALLAAVYFVPSFPCCILVAFMTHPPLFQRSLYSRIISFCLSTHLKHLRHISDLAPAHS